MQPKLDGYGGTRYAERGRHSHQINLQAAPAKQG